MPSLTPSSPEIISFMKKASGALEKELTQPKDVMAFGDTPSMQNELLDLVLEGKKTATTSWPIPSPRHWDVGDLSIVLNGDREPCAIFRTLELLEKKFNEVDVQHVIDEGEDDGDLQSWREGHTRYFGRQAKESGLEFGEQSMVLCERFELVYPLKE